MDDCIVIRGARLHNLKNVTVTIPRQRLVVVTGLSGSGKSTLVFDILHTEGQRQYVESLGISNESLRRPPVDAIERLSPSIGVAQNMTNRSPRSTVGTITEIFTYLRLLYARVGQRPCPRCGQTAAPCYAGGDEGADDWADSVDGEQPAGEARTAAQVAMPTDGESDACRACGELLPRLSMAHFSFNTPLGACPTCTGLGMVRQVNVPAIVNLDVGFLDGAVSLWNQMMTRHHSNSLSAGARHYGVELDLNAPIKTLGPAACDLLLYGASSPEFLRHVPQDVKPPKSVAAGNFEGVIPTFMRRYEAHAEDPEYREEMERSMSLRVCEACLGARLRPESRAVTVHGVPIHALSHQPLRNVAAWLGGLTGALSAEARLVAEPIVDELAKRAGRLVDAGVGYLSLERTAPSLSPGEAQRLRLATLLGSGLSGVLYVLDEPTAGLHPHDNGLLIESLRRLRDQGNSVVVVEHDLDIIRAADHVIELGPGAGEDGGRVVVTGTPRDVAACAQSATGRFLARAPEIRTTARPVQRGPLLTITGAREHNLQNVTVEIPLGVLVAVTGVSGAGKSTLVLDTLGRAARQRFSGVAEVPGEHDAIDGWEHLERVITVSQEPIGRTPRSNAATYTEAYDPIRRAFAATDAARQHGLKAEHFSFNVAGGRCEWCEGAGARTIKMHFMPEALVRCPVCHGRRFKRHVLDVQIKGRSIADVLEMPIAEAAALFGDVAAVSSKLTWLVDVGLGYLKLGQPATTLSGGEAQRMRLARELSRRSKGSTLYLLDEPTTGLHPADVARLLVVLQRLVEAGNTVVIIEHNLDLIRSADWIVDLGPKGGDSGGRIVATGTPEQVALVDASYTGRTLRAEATRASREKTGIGGHRHDGTSSADPPRNGRDGDDGHVDHPDHAGRAQQRARTPLLPGV